MELLETRLKGSKLIKPRVFGDERGFFTETYRRNAFTELGIAAEMVQDNHSRSSHAIVRGMHFQIGAGTAKLVRCGRGAIYDVIVDLREDSPVFRRHFAVALSADDHTMLYVPEGVAHGFQTLVDMTEVAYQMSAFHAPAHARGVRWNDPAFGIEWPPGERILSARDRSYPDFVPGRTP